MPEDDLIQTFEDWTEKSPDIMALRWLKNKLSELEKDKEVNTKAFKILSERIEKLESKIFHDYGGDLNQIEDAAVIQIELVKQISELRLRADNRTSLFDHILGRIGTTEEVLREFLVWKRDYRYIDGELKLKCVKWLAKLDQKDGDTSVIVRKPQMDRSKLKVDPTGSIPSEPKTHGCFNCRYLIDYDLCNERDMESYEKFMYYTFLTAICNNWREKELTDLVNTSEPLYKARQTVETTDMFGCPNCGTKWDKTKFQYYT